jgi:hypothetical protein
MNKQWQHKIMLVSLIVALMLAGQAFSAATAMMNASVNATALPGLSVSGINIVANGQPVRLRGINMGDPFLARNPAWYPMYTTANYATIAQNWHANAVRISIFPTQWKNMDHATLLAGLAQEVNAALNNGLYVIISYHVIGWPDGFQQAACCGNPADTYDTSMILANSFWAQMALTYGADTRIIFDLWNEPVHDATDWNDVTYWTTLKPFYESLIQTARNNGAQNIVLATGSGWASWLGGIKDSPLADANVVYAYHKYSNNGFNTAAVWDQDTGGLIGVKPVIVSEWGYEDSDVAAPTWAGSQASYGNPFTQWMDSRNLSNLAWMYHHDWTPALLKADGSLTIYGAFVKNYISTSAPPAPGGCSALVVDSGVADAGKSINGFLNDQYTWYDSACKPRSVALARNDASKGGNAKQFTYMLADGVTTRTINPSANGASGFGYVVAHLSNPSFAWSYGADDSPLGSGSGATYNKLFSGENHAIHEYTLNYVRYGLTQAAITNHSIDPWTWINDAADPNRQYVTAYNMPVRIQWMFATGRDYPVWSVTFDLSAAPDHAIDSDFRAPYGDMNVEGGDGTDLVGGVAWGDKYKFVTSGSPFTMDNDWDYSQLNAGAPYDSLWTSVVDAEMGLAGTQITASQNAGGYNNYLAPIWRGKTSATMGQICMNDGGAGPAYNHKLPCTSDWAYQLIQYSVASANETTNNKRLAWGADWGSLGNSSFTSSNGYAVSGYPKVSYSVYVVLDPHSKNPTQNMAAQAQTVSLTALTASVGTVRTQGIAGVGRADLETYSPAGFSPIFGTWEVDALNNNVNLSFAVSNLAPSTLDTPIVVIHNYTAPASSAQVLLDGVTLTANSDYFISTRPSESELWVTLNKKLTGTHNFQVITAPIIDTTPPSVSMSSAAANPTNTSPIAVTVTFSENVTGFTAGDITASNGTVGNFVANSSASYTFSLIPSANGLVTADIAAGVAQDSAGNGNTIATQFSRTYDATPPSISMSSAAANPTNTSSIAVTVTFSESVTGFTAGDITASNSVVSNFAGSGASYAFNLSPSANGLVTADIAAGVAQDSAGNGNTIAAQFSRTYDATPPTVAITSLASEPTSVSPIAVTVTFSENVTGFTAGDITTSNGAVGNFVANSGASYTFDLAPSASGLVTADIAAGVATDSAGNGNAAAIQFSRTYTTTPPVPVEISTNGGFNTYTGASKIPTSWKASKTFGASDGKSKIHKDGSYSVMMTGATVNTKTLTKTLSQAITLNGSTGDAFTFSFWAKGISIPKTGICRAQILFYNNSTLNPVKPTVDCGNGKYGFKLKTLPFNAPGAYTRIVIKFIYSKASGTVWFDAVSLLINIDPLPVKIGARHK